jgi:uncharacterized damage-inducible protein DinB
MHTLLQQYADFNLWANTRMTDWLGQHPHLLAQPILSSFPSLRSTLLHIWDAELIWLRRFRHLPIEFLPSRDFEGSDPALFADLLANSTDFRDFFAEQEADFLEQKFTYNFINGTQGESIGHHMLLHCIQHSTFHRGQLVTMARGLGLTDPPKTDFIHYTREAQL